MIDAARRDFATIRKVAGRRIFRRRLHLRLDQLISCHPVVDRGRPGSALPGTTLERLAVDIDGRAVHPKTESAIASWHKLFSKATARRHASPAASSRVTTAPSLDI